VSLGFIDAPKETARIHKLCVKKFGVTAPPVTILQRCKQCGLEFEPTDSKRTCPVCGTANQVRPKPKPKKKKSKVDSANHDRAVKYGPKLRELRKSRNMRYADAAKECGLATRTFMRAEKADILTKKTFRALKDNGWIKEE
jgi:uncharacterized Zn finger protein (UPF0148 family)